MRVRFTIGVGKADQERDLLDRYRSGARSSVAGADPAQRRPGWPVPPERADDDEELVNPAWAW